VMRALGLADGDKLVCPKCKGTEDNNVTPMGGFKCHRTSHCTAPFMSNMKLVAFHQFGADDLKNGVFRKSYTWLRQRFTELPALSNVPTSTPMRGPGMSVDDADVVEPETAVTLGPQSNGYHHSDTGNAQRLVDTFGEGLRYCPEVGMWLAWTGTYWAWDTCSLMVQEKTKEVVAGIHAEAAALDDPDKREALFNFAMKSESTRAIEATIKNARSDERVRIALGHLDKNDDLVNFANGTFDLGPCVLRPHDPKDLLTTLLTFDYDADAKCPKFRALLERAKPDSEEQAFRIRRLGQYLSGKPDKSFIISWGPKDTAKSTYYQTVAAVLGPYASRVPRTVIEKSFHEQHPAHLMTLKGKRLCFGAEIREGIDIDRIKELTGESDIPARGMGENWITIRRTWKLEIYSNDKPRIDFTTDDGMATRTIFDPWLVQIPKDEQIANYHEVLAAEEATGILALMVEGWKEFKRLGLAPPKSILAATERFLDEQGGFMEWIAECCDITKADAETPTDELFESYRAWFEKTIGRKLPAKMTKQRFGMRLGKKYASGQRDNVKVRRGIKVNGRNVPAYDLNEPCIEVPGMSVMDIFYEREIEALMREGQEAA
jgi:putative DNA primase/helicase